MYSFWFDDFLLAVCVYLVHMIIISTLLVVLYELFFIEQRFIVIILFAIFVCMYRKTKPNQFCEHDMRVCVFVFLSFSVYYISFSLYVHAEHTYMYYEKKKKKKTTKE